MDMYARASGSAAGFLEIAEDAMVMLAACIIARRAYRNLCLQRRRLSDSEFLLKIGPYRWVTLRESPLLVRSCNPLLVRSCELQMLQDTM